MDGFRVCRDGVEIKQFHRPIVVRLLQYFAVNRGRPIPRDRILEDLWPDSPPGKAWTTFRTVYSRLRNTLEPHMRSKGPNRYFALDGDAYIFDANNCVSVDIEQFEHAVNHALAANTPIDTETTQLLADYSTILPDLPYADWLLETRERVNELHLNGMLRVGQEMLARGDSADAQKWAQRILQKAPWMEAAYQLLMRAYSRQHMRTRALRTYQDAKDALQVELAVEPSPLTDWLQQRLQNGEAI